MAFFPIRSSSPANVNKVAEGPPPEDEPEFDGSLVLLDWYNSDLNLTISKTDFVSAAPLTESGFAYMWAGARATYGFEKGKIYFEVKVMRIIVYIFKIFFLVLILILV